MLTVKLGTADITEVDHENLIFAETPEASAASGAQLLSDWSRLSLHQLRESYSKVITPLVATCNQLDKKRGQ